MRSRVYALIAAAIAIALIPIAAEAGHRRHYEGDYQYNRRGWADVYRPFYHRHYRSDLYLDPYRYTYEPVRYYPYYNSGYWRPTSELRHRRACCRPFAALPPYYKAWGYPKRSYGRYYAHRRWNRVNHRRW